MTRSLLLLVASALALAPEDPAAVVVGASVVRVEVDAAPTAPELDRLYRWTGIAGPGFGAPRRSTGTGVVVGDPPVVLTNHHVVAGARAVTLRTHEGERVVVAPAAIRADARADLAVLPAPGLVAAPLADAEPPGDAAVALVGFVGGGPLRAVPGSLGPLRLLALPGSPERTLREVDAAVARGLSGGALVDEGGRVVGLAVAGSTAGSRLDGRGAAVPLAALRDALDRLSPPCTPGELGVRVRPAADGVEVVDVVPGTPAAAAELLPGDRILAVDGHHVRDAWDLGATCAGRRHLTVARDGRVSERGVETRPAQVGARLVHGGHGAPLAVTGGAHRLGLDRGDPLPADAAEGDAPRLARVEGKGWVILPAP